MMLVCFLRPGILLFCVWYCAPISNVIYIFLFIFRRLIPMMKKPLIYLQELSFKPLNCNFHYLSTQINFTFIVLSHIVL